MSNDLIPTITNGKIDLSDWTGKQEGTNKVITPLVHIIRWYCDLFDTNMKLKATLQLFTKIVNGTRT